jgi:hypothetical protein
VALVWTAFRSFLCRAPSATGHHLSRTRRSFGTRLSEPTNRAPISGSRTSSGYRLRSCLLFEFKCLTMKLEAKRASDMLSWSRPKVTHSRSSVRSAVRGMHADNCLRRQGRRPGTDGFAALVHRGDRTMRRAKSFAKSPLVFGNRLDACIDCACAKPSPCPLAHRLHGPVENVASCIERAVSTWQLRFASARLLCRAVAQQE